MVQELLKSIPPDFIKFILVTIFSLLIGLEQRRQHINLEPESLFGTDRTFTLIGILGFVLYVIAPQTLLPFLGGGFALSIFLGIFYFQKIQQKEKFGATTVMIALITYCLGPLIYMEPLWMELLVVVSVLILTGIKETLFEFSQKVSGDEFITLAKFIILAGIILPLLPHEPISTEINVSPYNIWLAIVVVSAISYFSYLLKKFVFPDAGILLTGLLGGLYSSTATTVILARKSKEGIGSHRIVPAILLATTMMYLRMLLLAFFFNREIALGLLPYFVFFVVLSSALVLIFMRVGKVGTGQSEDNQNIQSHDNPLEFKTAMVFGGLFILFAVATGYVLKYYGKTGINIMAYVVGVTDIDPFIINLFQNKAAIANSLIVMAVLNAIASNNLLKLIYALVLSDKSLRKNLIISFSILVILGIAAAFLSQLI